MNLTPEDLERLKKILRRYKGWLAPGLDDRILIAKILET